MDISKEDFNDVYTIIFESVGEDVKRDIHRVFGGKTI